MKNIHVFATELPSLSDIEQKLSGAEGMLFSPLLENQSSKFGFNPESTFVALDNGYKINFVFSFKKLPKEAIKEEAERRLAIAETEADEHLSQAEFTECQAKMVEDVFNEYCEKVLPETEYFTAYYHTKSMKFIVDSKEEHAKRAVSMLVQLLGSLETSTLHCSGISNSLTSNMLECLNATEGQPEGIKFAGFNAGDLLVLGNPAKDVVRFKGDYPFEQVRDLLNDGYEVKQINLSKDGLGFTLTEKFKINSIRTFFQIEEDGRFDDPIDLRHHEEAVELELIVSHCQILKDFFDKSNESNK